MTCASSGIRMLLSGWYKPGVDGSLRIFGGPHTLRPLAGHDSPCTQGDFLSAVAFVVFVVSGVGGRHRAQDQIDILYHSEENESILASNVSHK